MNCIKVEVVKRKSINYALVRNQVKTVQSVRIINDSAEDFGEAILKMECSPAFSKGAEVEINLVPNARIEIGSIDVEVLGDYLANLNEKIVGNLLFSVIGKVKNEDGISEQKVLFETTETIELLPYNQWSGVNELPEYLASFVMPNHPEVISLLPKVAKQLEKWKKDPALTGYLTEDKNVAKYQAAAAYEVLKEEGIVYCVSESSFENIGQKIRTPDEIVTQKLGNCLDLSCMYSSILEACGLNSIIILMDDHAYVGCLLEDYTFTNPVEDDIAAISKRCAEGIDEIVLVECTALTAGNMASFEEASDSARIKLFDENKFRMAIDIKRCRSNRVLPLPSRIMENGKYRVVEFETKKKESEAPKDLSERGINATASENVMTKQKLWERKLLDLSLRNPLINFRVTKSFIQLASGDIGRLEDVLRDGDSLSVCAFGNDAKVTPGESKMYNIPEIREILKAGEDDDYKSKRIRTFMEEKDLDAGMKYLSRQAKLSLEENGSNTLFLALGFLKWYENDISTKERYSPLILVPIDITKRIQDKSYSVKIRDEEAIFNVTLLEFLRQNYGMDIGGLDPLPQDESGIDVPLLLNTVRKSIMDKKHWDVCDYAFLGLFSFSRFIMWNDLKNRSDDILENKVVKSLLNGKLEWEPSVTIDELDKLDEKVKPSDMAIVCSADESQLKAIQTSSLGESFVLHGPPGTGKSQTITNMIANALYQGKSVLFVAEKMAALSVVQSRLEKVGLGPFCLELHSNKAQKQAVLTQLERTLQTAGKAGNENFEAKAENLFELRKKLNDLVTELHKKQHYGKSIYELIGDYEANRELEGKINLSNSFVEETDSKKYEEILALLDEYNIIVDEIGEVGEHPLKSYVIKDYSLERRNEWHDLLKKMSEELGETKATLNEVTNALGYVSDKRYKREYATWLEMTLKKGKNIKTLPAEIDTLDEFEAREESFRTKINALSDLANIKAKLLEGFRADIFTYDYVSARNRLITAQGKWALVRMKEINSLIKELKYISVKPNEVTEKTLSDIYDRIENYHNVKEKAEPDDTFKKLFSGCFDNENTDVNKAKEILENTKSYLKSIKNCPDKNMPSDTAVKIVSLYASEEKHVFEDYINKSEKLCLTESKLMTDFGLKVYEFEDEEDYFAAMKTDIAIALDNEEEMRSYAALCDTEDKLEKFGLDEAFTAVREKVLYTGDLVGAFKCNFGKTAAVKEVNENAILKGFNGASFTAMIEKFKTASDEFERLTKEEVIARLSANVPKVGKDIAATSEIGILQRSIKSGRRAMPIRKLFNEIPTLLRRMCPCMLMSPISVAQYIDPTFPKFDLVIFDEASQLPTSESVGVLARGENVIVVGDPKQLPPTSFFMTNHEDEEDFEFNDMESLLDDCLAISMPGEHLLWHYRSRHESLIAYSNMTYYDNKLYTFPSPNDLVSEVKFIPVEGVYERGKRKVNRAEGEAIVKEIMERLKDPVRQKDSIGVVTFSQVQQAFIEDLLQDALHEEPDVALYAQALEEPIFVKNLENVQGDERDVILFSVCYGPDENGKVSMNFGPLNQDGGWRRLNVAISRARKSMMIFSTIKPEQIDISRTSAEGVIGLRGFLEFASLGKNALFTRNELVKKRNNQVARSIKEKLASDGYNVNLDIGTSEYHLDMGVIDPRDDKRYCLGILLDGENYSAGDSARDRNILQPSVLKGLGWRLHRVWTLDWFDTPDKEYEKIKEAINKSMSDEKDEEEDKEEAAKENIGFEKEEIVESVDEHPNRRVLNLYTVKELGDSEDFMSPGHDKRIVREAEEILKVEAPISEKALVKKLLQAYGIARITTKSEERIYSLLREYPLTRTTSAGETFIWLEEMNPTDYSIYRIPEDAKDARPINEIPAEEIVNAVTEVVNLNVSLSMEDCVRATGKIFGIAKLSATLDKAVRVAVSYGEQRGILQISDDGERVVKKSE